MSRRKRVLAALVMAPVAIGAVLWLPTSLLAALVAGVMMLGLWEWTLLAGTTGQTARACYLAANVSVMTALAWLAGSGLPVLPVAATVGVAWWVLVLAWLTRFEFAQANTAGARILKLLAGSLSVIPAWAALCWLHGSGPRGPAWALFALFIVWIADTGAYFVGVRFGKHKLAPRISPGKSWEGFAGGLVATLLLAVAGARLLGVAWSDLSLLLLLTGVTALVSVAGDLFESLLKRHAGAKDSSHLIPGHGGVLDRVDSLLAALPVFVVGKQWLGL
jgi:phosphatidate cytidylyltransferase